MKSNCGLQKGNVFSPQAAKGRKVPRGGNDAQAPAESK